MNILDKIIETKKRELVDLKEITTIKSLESSLYFESPIVSLSQYLQREDKLGIIAEIKRTSPSTDIDLKEVNVESLSISYMQSGASALSILTEQNYFSGSNHDLQTARKFNFCPILRKDFIVEPYQVIESKSIGADCILLIAACLDPKLCRELARLAQSLGLEVLLEVHSKDEIETYVNEYIDIIGINNRDLSNFSTDINKSLELYDHLPTEIIKISESGISEADQIVKLKERGFDGFLIGGHFMRSTEPARTCKNMIEECLVVQI